MLFILPLSFFSSRVCFPLQQQHLPLEALALSKMENKKHHNSGGIEQNRTDILLQDIYKVHSHNTI